MPDDARVGVRDLCQGDSVHQQYGHTETFPKKEGSFLCLHGCVVYSVCFNLFSRGISSEFGVSVSVDCFKALGAGTVEPHRHTK